MSLKTTSSVSEKRPLLFLTVVFLVWKGVLFAIAVSAPGIGYDTSTDIWLSWEDVGHGSEGLPTQSYIRTALKKFVRWDAFYFVSVARRNYQFEQEWAFGMGYPALISLLSSFTPRIAEHAFKEVAVGMLISNASHLLSVISLFFLCQTLAGLHRDHNLSLVAALLHIFAPAGIFLSAPVGESFFSLLSITGYLCYANSVHMYAQKRNGRTLPGFHLLLSGLLLGLATTVRSNGILNGLIFLADLIEHLLRNIMNGHLFREVRRMSCTIISGLLIGAGFIIPQYLAYSKFCLEGAFDRPDREWCHHMPPSIYSFVQQHYWGVGFLRYWTLPNVPLFALALPMLAATTLSALWALNVTKLVITMPKQSRHTISNLRGGASRNLMVRLALPQLLLTVLAVTSFHVQIITRIASAYPLPYVWLASKLVGDGQKQSSSTQHSMGSVQWLFRGMIMYALIQAGLFASFLPPA